MTCEGTIDNVLRTVQKLHGCDKMTQAQVNGLTPFNSERGRIAGSKVHRRGRPPNIIRRAFAEVAWDKGLPKLIECLNDRSASWKEVLHAIEILCRYGLGLEKTIHVRHHLPSVIDCASRLRDMGVPEEQWPQSFRAAMARQAINIGAKVLPCPGTSEAVRVDPGGSNEKEIV